MEQSLEMVWFGLGLAALGGMAAFLLWFPSFEEQDSDHYGYVASRQSSSRGVLLTLAGAAVIGGLVMAIFNLIKYLR
ncbi:hypothetical protein JW859_10875 [bacterium]|nr:hypothetical protein [bacterium]